MAVPLLEYQLSSQNSRVGYISGNSSKDGKSVRGNASQSSVSSSRQVDELIEQAYRQVFFHAMKCDREPLLESQLKNGSITVRDFIRGLLTSKRFRNDYYQCSSNYRVVEQVIGRVLGRQVYGEDEKRAWSIVVAEQGLVGFIDAVLSSDEYLSLFGYDRVPEQRDRILPGRGNGEMPIYQKLPRYGAEWRDVMQTRAPSKQMAMGVSAPINKAWENGQPPKILLKLWLAIAIIGSIEIARVILVSIASIFRT
jgi:phycobilisome rod-core linker protein